MIKINTPLSEELIKSLHIGDRITISGTIYTARDVAHKRFCDVLKSEKRLPIDLAGQIIFYAGPAHPRPGQVIGSIGPTTSYRMDFCTPLLLRNGLKGMIGKGPRSDEVKKVMQEVKAVYFAATGGTAAFLAKYVTKAKVVAYEDLGPEAVLELEVKDFPVIVAIDCYGGDLYEEGVKKYMMQDT